MREDNRIFEGFKSTAGGAAMVFQWSRVSYDAYNRVKTIDDALRHRLRVRRQRQARAPSRTIDRCMAGTGLLAHVLVSKYCDHTPL